MGGITGQEDPALAIALGDLSCKRKGLHPQEFHIEVRYPSSRTYQGDAPLSIVVLEPLAVLRMALHTEDPPAILASRHKDAGGLWMLYDVQTMNPARNERIEVGAEEDTQKVGQMIGSLHGDAEVFADQTACAICCHHVAGPHQSCVPSSAVDESSTD